MEKLNSKKEIVYVTHALQESGAVFVGGGVMLGVHSTLQALPSLQKRLHFRFSGDLNKDLKVR